MARVTHATGFGFAGRMWHRNDEFPEELVTDEMVRLGWVARTPASPRVETATAAPGEVRSSGRTRKTAAKKTAAKKK